MLDPEVVRRLQEVVEDWRRLNIGGDYDWERRHSDDLAALLADYERRGEALAKVVEALTSQKLSWVEKVYAALAAARPKGQP